MPAWSEEIPGYSSILASPLVRERGGRQRLAAEPAGRRAIELDPGDLWAAARRGPSMEMQGRRSEGIEWLNTPRAQVRKAAHNLQAPSLVALCLVHARGGDYAAVSNSTTPVFETSLRRSRSPSPDVYIDVQNAASILFRLQRLGVDVGNRWE